MPEWRCFCVTCWRRFWAHRLSAPDKCPFCHSQNITADPAPAGPTPKDAA